MADIRTLSRLGVGTLCAVTAVTAQTHQALLGASVLPAELVRSQIEAPLRSATIGAVKIGMLATAATVQRSRRPWAGGAQVPVVLDPVSATSLRGRAARCAGTRRPGSRALLPLATLLTQQPPGSRRAAGAARGAR